VLGGKHTTTKQSRYPQVTFVMLKSGNCAADHIIFWGSNDNRDDRDFESCTRKNRDKVVSIRLPPFGSDFLAGDSYYEESRQSQLGQAQRSRFFPAYWV
jgi:hypothetical protein